MTGQHLDEERRHGRIHDEPPIGPEGTESFCRRYSRRWQIENEYESLKNDFLAKTSSKDYRVRLFYFVFAVLLYNIWRLTDLLLKTGIDGEMDYAPVLTAGECVEIAVSALIPPARPTAPPLGPSLGSSNTVLQHQNPRDFERLLDRWGHKGSK